MSHEKLFNIKSEDVIAFEALLIISIIFNTNID